MYFNKVRRLLIELKLSYKLISSPLGFMENVQIYCTCLKLFQYYDL